MTTVIKRYQDLRVGDNIIATEAWAGVVVTQQGVITRLQHGEVILGGEYSFEWAPEITIVVIGTLYSYPTAKHRKD